MRKCSFLTAALLITAVLVCVGPVLAAAKAAILLPLNRTEYQTNELIDISVTRSDTQALQAGNLVLSVAGTDGSKLSFTFPVKAVFMVGNDASTTEHLHLNGWLLRPGSYQVTASVDGATTPSKSITVYTHLRRSTYRLVHWNGPGGDAMATEGEDGMGFNLILGGIDEPSIRGGVDIMGCDIMGGGHQFDLKPTNDWSDPYVYLGANQRAMDVAFSFRTMPNGIGAHLYDKPGLTWLPNGHTGVNNDHDIPPQRRAFKGAYDKEALWYDQYDPKDPVKKAEWEKVNDFKLGFMDAFWKSSKQALDRMKPGYLVATQSQYGWSALYDGYYFNVVRSLPVVSGHGGYNDFGLRNFNPSMFLEMAMPRQLDKPNWYLPGWGLDPGDGFRLEQNMSFITGIQGLDTPPGLNIGSECVADIISTNKLFARLGTIFAKPEYTRQDLALLYSKSCAYQSTSEPNIFGNAMMMHMATKMIQYPSNVVLDEDVIDGSLAADHKAVLLCGITYLDPAVLDGLAAFIKGGGVVLETAECSVNIPGATKLDVNDAALLAAANVQSAATTASVKGVTDKAALAKAAAITTKLSSFKAQIDYAEPLAKALKTALAAHNIRPAFNCDCETIAPGRQVRGDIEYLFAVNFTPKDYGVDPSLGGYGLPVSTKATISLPNDGRPVYNAISGGPAPFKLQGDALASTLTFGPGEMMVFARTAHPIGGMTVSTPVINRDFTRDTDPQRIEFTATLLDTQNRVIAGTAPLEIKVTDPLGVVRYDLYRATEDGVCAMSLPLAANDPSGTWTVAVKELLNNTYGIARFTYKPAPQCGALAGMTPRAVFYQYDQDNIYQFFRNHRNVTIVTGKSDFNNAAAERLVNILAPYNVRCTIISSDDANKPRELTELEAKTWCGSNIAGDAKPGRDNNPAVVGYDLPGPTILLGNPKDNPLIAHLEKPYYNYHALPYPASADFIGRGHGMLAWNFASLGHDIESVSCIAYDAEGMSEAVGTLFQLAIGVDPLTPLVLPSSNSVTPATTRVVPHAASTLWQCYLPDRVAALAVANGKLTAACANGDGCTITLKAGKTVLLPVSPSAVPTPAKVSLDTGKLPKAKLCPDLKVKQVLAGNSLTAVSYWGGRLQLFDAAGNLKTQQQLPQDITALLWNGDTLVAGLADGCILGLSAK